ncbi:hypothetical protein MRX96_020332 [Rhipicephalus microplus]
MLIPALFVVQIALWPKGLSTGLVTHLHTNGTTPVITDDTTTGNESAQAPAIFYILKTSPDRRQLFGDDIVLLAESATDLQDLLNICSQIATEDHLKFNTKRLNGWS